MSSLFYPFVPSITPFGTNDFDSLMSLFDEPAHRRHCRTVPTFTPRFDIKETKTGYELHGELPGIEQKDVEIEWTASNNLTIRGHTEYTREESTRPVTEEAKPATEEAKPAGEEEGWTSVSEGEKHENSHKATVEDEPEAGESSVAAVTKTEPEKEVAKPAKPAKPTSKYWISERSVGQFRRTFQFPGPIDKEGVKATMKNGVLNVSIPKQEPKVHRIHIE